MSISFTKLGSFLSLFFQTEFQFLTLSLLLLVPLDLNVGTFEVVPEAAYPILVFFGFFFLLAVLVECFFLPCVILPDLEKDPRSLGEGSRNTMASVYGNGSSVFFPKGSVAIYSWVLTKPSPCAMA